MAELLKVENLVVEYPGKGFRAKPFRALNNVSITLGQSETLGLVGESGSGKSVLALSLVKLIEGAKLSGRCLWTRQDEQNLAPDATDAPNTLDLVKLTERDLEPIRGQDIAFVFQEPMTALNPVFSVGEQIAEVLQIKRGMTREEAWHEAIDLIKVTGITDPVRRAKSYPHQLSGGQRQRVMIAMALACQPQLLIADEPTTALDVTIQRQVIELLASLKAKHGLSVLFISHDLSIVRYLADRVLVMYLGHVVETGTTEEVFQPPYHPYTEALLSAVPIADTHVTRKRIVLDGDIPSAMNPPPGCPFQTRCRWKSHVPGGLCDREMPPVQNLAQGHQIKCHLSADVLATMEPVIKIAAE